MALGSQTSGCCWSPATGRSDGSAPASPHSAPTCGHTACLSFSPGRRNMSSPQTSPHRNLWTIGTHMCLSPCPELAAQGLAQSHVLAHSRTGRWAKGQTDSQTDFCVSADHLSCEKATPDPQTLEFQMLLSPSILEEDSSPCITQRHCPHTQSVPSLRQLECHSQRGLHLGHREVK